MVPPPGTFNVS